MKQGIKILPPDLFNGDGNWDDYYLEIKHLKRGDIFYESDNRNALNYQLKALEDAKKTKNGWICKAQTADGNIVELYVSAATFSSSFPGPNLFKLPQILSFIDGVGYVYQIN
jgi:hypothetical protein